MYCAQTNSLHWFDCGLLDCPFCILCWHGAKCASLCSCVCELSLDLFALDGELVSQLWRIVFGMLVSFLMAFFLHYVYVYCLAVNIVLLLLTCFVIYMYMYLHVLLICHESCSWNFLFYHENNINSECHLQLKHERCSRCLYNRNCVFRTPQWL